MRASWSQRLTAVLAALIIPAAVPGCAREGGDQAPAVIRIATTAPKDPGQGGVVGLDYMTGVLVRETLGSIGRDGRVTARLAEQWTVSDDGREWLFQLRPNVVFHDGTKLTSDVLVPLLKSRLTGLAEVEEIAAAGPLAVRIRLRRASPFLLEEVAFESLGLGPQRQIGTGPFKLMPAADGPIRFVPFDQYRLGTPGVTEVTLTQYSNLRNTWVALMKGDADVVYEVSGEARDFVDAETSVELASFVRPYVYLLGINHMRPPFRDANVRVAMNMGIDRGALIDQGLKGFGIPAYDHFWPAHWAVDSSRSRIDRDRGKAISLLQERFPVKAAPPRMPSRFRFHCLVYEPLERLGLALQRQFAEMGIDMSIETLQLGPLVARTLKGDFDAFLFEMASARSLSFPYRFWHSPAPGAQMPQFGYASADAMLDRVRYARSDDEIRAAVADLQAHFKADPPAIFLAWSETARAVTTRFVVPREQDEDIFHSIFRWKPVAPAPRTN